MKPKAPKRKVAHFLHFMATCTKIQHTLQSIGRYCFKLEILQKWHTHFPPSAPHPGGPPVSLGTNPRWNPGLHCPWCGCVQAQQQVKGWVAPRVEAGVRGGLLTKVQGCTRGCTPGATPGYNPGCNPGCNPRLQPRVAPRIEPRFNHQYINWITRVPTRVAPRVDQNRIFRITRAQGRAQPPLPPTTTSWHPGKGGVEP